MADFLESMGDAWDGEGELPEPTVETPETPPAETEAPQEVEAQAEPEEQPQDGEKPEPHSVPYSAMKKERERAQAAERRLAELEATRTAQPVQPVAPARTAEPDVIPDPYEDPVGYAAYNQAQIAQAKWEMRAEMSGQRAETVYGKETVEAAVAWAQEQGLKDPTLGQRVAVQASPVEYVVQQYQQSLTLETIAGRSFEDAARDYATQQGWIVSPEPTLAPASQTPAPVPPRSLARVPGSGNRAAPTGADWGEVKFPLG